MHAGTSKYKRFFNKSTSQEHSLLVLDVHIIH
jgi:hypothetical protein